MDPNIQPVSGGGLQNGTRIPLRDYLDHRIDDLNHHLDQHVAQKEHAMEALEKRVEGLEVRLANLTGRIAAVGAVTVVALSALELILRFVVQ